MQAIETAEAVAALWFTAFFGLALIAPAFTLLCKAVRKRREIK